MSSKDRQTETAAMATVRGGVRPPLLFLAALMLGFALDHLLPLPMAIPKGGELMHRLIPGSIAVMGLVIFAAGIRNFQKADTPVPGNQPVQALVTGGIHGWSRNPIYIGMILFYFAIGIAVRSPWILILLIPAFLILRFAVIAREEKYLEQRFEDSYREYKARVRRWI